MNALSWIEPVSGTPQRNDLSRYEHTPDELLCEDAARPPAETPWSSEPQQVSNHVPDMFAMFLTRSQPLQGRSRPEKHARRLGAGGDGVVDGAQGVGDVEQPVCLGAADAELRGSVRLPAAVTEREPHPGGVRVTDPGSEHRHGAPDVVHRLAQPGRHLPGLLRAERRPRRFGDVTRA